MQFSHRMQANSYTTTAKPLPKKKTKKHGTFTISGNQIDPRKTLDFLDGTHPKKKRTSKCEPEEAENTKLRSAKTFGASRSREYGSFLNFFFFKLPADPPN